MNWQLFLALDVELIKSAMHFDATKIKLLVLDPGAVHQIEVSRLGFVQIKHRAVHGRNVSMQANHSNFVAVIGRCHARLPLVRYRWL